jgi:aminopeptidase C
MLETVYRILSIHNGEPPRSFEWSWRDEDDA